MTKASQSDKHAWIISSMLKITIVAAVVMFLFSLFMTKVNTDAAGAARISLSSSATNYNTNQKITVSVAINNAEVLSGGFVELVYDPAKLKYESYLPATTPFDTDLYFLSSAGNLKVARTTFGAGSSGTISFMTVQFTALTAGTSSVSVGGTSKVWLGSNGSDVWNGSQAVLNFNISAPVIITPPPPNNTPNNPPATNTNTNTNTNANTNTNTGTGPAQTTFGSLQNQSSPSTPQTQTSLSLPQGEPDGSPKNPPATDVVENSPEVTQSRISEAIVRLKSRFKVRAKIFYGIDNQLALASAETDFTTEPEILLPAESIVPGRTYSYKVMLTDENGNITETEVRTFRAKGYGIQIKIVDLKNNPVKKTTVVINSERRESVTDENGNVVFDDMESGQHSLTVDVKGDSYTQILDILANASLDENGIEIVPLQTTTVQITTTIGFGFGFTIASYSRYISGLLLITLVIFGAYWIMKRKQAMMWPFSPDSSYTSFDEPIKHDSSDTPGTYTDETLSQIESRVRVDKNSPMPEQIIEPTITDKKT